MIKIGSHVGNSGKLMLEGSIYEALNNGANCFMVYLGAPQNSIRKSVSELNIEKMHKIMDLNNIPYDNVIVHAPYIVNLASLDPEKRKFGTDFITRELKTTNLLKARCLVLHPGAYTTSTVEEGINNISACLIQILKNTENDGSIIALETMAGKGTEIGRNFQELKQIIDKVNSPRIKVCLDTCHVFDSGYDLVNEYENVLKEFDDIIGLENICCIHLNDSKNICGSHKDRHENAGIGNIGFPTLLKVCYDARFTNVPKILESPYVEEKSPFKQEIKMYVEGCFNNNLLHDIIVGE